VIRYSNIPPAIRYRQNTKPLQELMTPS